MTKRDLPLARRALIATLFFTVVPVVGHASNDGACLVAPTTNTLGAQGHTWAFTTADPGYPLDYLQTKDGSAFISPTYGAQWSNSSIMVQNGGNLYAFDNNYGGGAYQWNGTDLASVTQLPISPDATIIAGGDKAPCLVDSSGNVWSFGTADGSYPLDYFTLKNGQVVSAGGGVNWSMSRMMILYDGTSHNLYAYDDNYGGGPYRWNGSTFASISSLPAWDPTFGGKGTSFMLYQCGSACNVSLSSNVSAQDSSTLMSYMEWYGDTTVRSDPLDGASRTVRQTGQNRLAAMLTPSSPNNPNGQNTAQITGEFRQFSPSGTDGSSPNGRGWYIPTNGYYSGGAFHFYAINGTYTTSNSWSLSTQVQTNVTNMIDDIVAARSTDGNNYSFKKILLHLQFIDNSAGYCLGNSNYNLVRDQNFAIMNQVREIIKTAISGTGIQLITDLDAEAAAYPAEGTSAHATGLHGFNCASVNSSWSGGVPAAKQYLIDLWSRYQGLSDINSGGEISMGFSSYNDLAEMLDGFGANSLPLPPIFGYDIYSNPSGAISTLNSVQASYYNGSNPLRGVWIMETDYTDLTNTNNRSWVTGTGGLVAYLNNGAAFPVLGINQWQTTDYFPGVGNLYDHTAIASSMNPVAFAYQR